LKYAYGPPLSVIIEPISVVVSTPNSVTTPASTQASSTSFGDSSSSDMGATFLYTPDPMMELTKRMTAAGRPKALTKSLCPCFSCSCMVYFGVFNNLAFFIGY
jgi:hypothetical protein